MSTDLRLIDVLDVILLFIRIIDVWLSFKLKEVFRIKSSVYLVIYILSVTVVCIGTVITLRVILTLIVVPVTVSLI